ncbi:IS66 family insertion sequence element accessory protein TnpB, partial [Alicyclobacillus mali (ex Roth et al. 2021)]
YYRRLERGRFDWPETGDAKTMVITRRELNWLLDGLPLEQPKAHRAVHVRSAI